MDGIHIAPLGQVDDRGDVQVGAQGALILPDEIGLVRPGAEETVCILIGIDGHRVESQVVAGAEDADGDLAAVCHQDLSKGVFCHGEYRPFLH